MTGTNRTRDVPWGCRNRGEARPCQDKPQPQGLSPHQVTPQGGWQAWLVLRPLGLHAWEPTLPAWGLHAWQLDWQAACPLVLAPAPEDAADQPQEEPQRWVPPPPKDTPGPGSDGEGVGWSSRTPGTTGWWQGPLWPSSGPPAQCPCTTTASTACTVRTRWVAGAVRGHRVLSPEPLRLCRLRRGGAGALGHCQASCSLVLTQEPTRLVPSAP